MEKIKTLSEYKNLLANHKYFTIDEEGSTVTNWYGQIFAEQVMPVHSRLRSKLSDRDDLEYLINPKNIILFNSLKQANKYIGHNLSELELSEDPSEAELSKVQALMIAITTTDTRLQWDAKLMVKLRDLKYSKKHVEIPLYYQEWLKDSRCFRHTCESILLEIQNLINL